MPRLPIVGDDNDQWGTLLNDYLSIAHNSDGTLKTSTLSNYATKTGAETLTGKTISGTANTFSNIPASAIFSSDTEEFVFGDAIQAYFASLPGYASSGKVLSSNFTWITQSSGLTQLSTPANFIASSVSSTQINLSWSDTANESSYLLERSPNGTSVWTTVTTPSAGSTSYANTGLTTTTQYYYRLSAIGNGTTYSSSGYATATATTNTSAQNLLRYSEEIDNQAVWYPGPDSSVIANTGTDVAGATTLDTITVISGYYNPLYQIITGLTASTQYCFSFEAKDNTITAPLLGIRDNTNSVDITGGYNYASQLNGSTATRVYYAFTTPTGCTSVILYILRDIQSNGSIKVGRALLNVGTIPGTYVTTTSSIVP